MNDHDHAAAATLAAALIHARAIIGGTPQQMTTTPEDAAALYLDCFTAIHDLREKRGPETITEAPIHII